MLISIVTFFVSGVHLACQKVSFLSSTSDGFEVDF